MTKRKINTKRSSNLHTSRQRTSYSCPPRARKLVLCVISVVFIGVIVAVVASLLFTPERTVKAAISGMATEYYEKDFYPMIADSFTSGTADVSRYENYGFAPVTLRQLLLYDDAKNADKSKKVLEYCDENGTAVKFYPEAPYGQHDYRVEYTYSCTF